MSIEIKELEPNMVDTYLDFFDHRAFSNDSPYYPCYCNAFNMSVSEIDKMRENARKYGGGTEGWKQSLRETASVMVREGKIHGYLAFDKEVAVGWCNTNDRMNYYRVGEFDLDNVPKDTRPFDHQREGQIKAIVYFEISPEYRGQGIATQILRRIIMDAKNEGYELGQAVTDGYLVDFLSVETKLKFIEQGIVYAELSDEDKAIYESTFEMEE